jgi:hypothetical protein
MLVSGLSRAALIGIYGTVAGAVATVPMTFTMAALHKLLTPPEPPAPQEIVHNFSKVAYFRRVVPLSWNREVLFYHFGYGALTGALYTVNLIPNFLKGHPNPYIDEPEIYGMEYGFWIWFLSYFGWIPATGLLSSPIHHSKRRTFLMIVSHLVWGGFTAYIYDHLYFFGPHTW